MQQKLKKENEAKKREIEERMIKERANLKQRLEELKNLRI